MRDSPSNPIILYDGVCALCNRFVQFVLRHDVDDCFRFASLQSDVASTILRRHSINPQQLDTLYLVLEYNASQECLLPRSDAVAAILTILGGFWRRSAWFLQLLPKKIRDWNYNLIARHRYRFIGKYDACPLPHPKDRHKFLGWE